MRRNLVVLLLICFALPLTVSAQETTPIPEAPVDVGPPTLESVTADPATYYGQTVTFEGVVEELVNTRSFVLGEGAALDDDQVLVLNNSGQEFNIGLTRDARVSVTGVIYPAFDQGGWDSLVPDINTGAVPMDDSAGDTMGDAMATEEAGEAGAEMTATEEAEMGGSDLGQMAPTGVTLSEYPIVVLQERFPSHTLLVVNSIDDIAFIEAEAVPADTTGLETPGS
jgi:hypothetical protein